MKPLLSVLLLALTSCSIAHKQATATAEEGYILYKQSAPDAVLTLFGDFNLHGLKSKYFTDLHKKDLKYFTRPLNGHRPKLMFAAHTTVQIYYSAVGVQYSNVGGDTVLMAAVKEELRQSLRTAFKEIEPVATRYGSMKGIAYHVKDPVTQRFTSHREYFVPYGGHLFRFFFWTSDRDDRILDEGAFILKNMKLE